MEKVELASGLPETAQRIKPAALTFLQDFIHNSVLETGWVEKYLGSDEITRLRQNIGYFAEPETVSELLQNLSPEMIRELIAEIPEILEMKLGRSQADESQEEEK